MVYAEAQMKDILVIVRGYGNEPLLRHVWSIGPYGVYVCTEDNFKALQAGAPALNPVGFAWADVFEYDAAKLARLMKGYKKNPALWGELERWDGAAFGQTEVKQKAT
jgi:hypothetical protein